MFSTAMELYQRQGAVHEALSILRERVKDLSNPHVIRLIEGYFFEMAVIIAELGRIVRPGGTAIMVNDNVQYHGEEVPVDLILSDYAESCGFTCERIWVLPRGKGKLQSADGTLRPAGAAQVRVLVGARRWLSWRTRKGVLRS